MTALLARNETLVAAVIALFCIVAPVSDPNFLTVTTPGDLLRASIVLGILAIGAMLVLILGRHRREFHRRRDLGDVHSHQGCAGLLARQAVVAHLPGGAPHRRCARRGQRPVHRRFPAADADRRPRHVLGVSRFPADLRRLGADFGAAAGHARLLAHDDRVCSCSRRSRRGCMSCSAAPGSVCG